MIMNRIIAAVLGLLIPGWGHAYYQRYRQALLFQGLLLLIIGLICWSRWVTDFSGGTQIYSLSKKIFRRSGPTTSGGASQGDAANWNHCL